MLHVFWLFSHSLYQIRSEGVPDGSLLGDWLFSMYSFQLLSRNLGARWLPFLLRPYIVAFLLDN